MGGGVKRLISDENVFGAAAYGENVSATLGAFYIDGSVGISLDYKGNIAVQAIGGCVYCVIKSQSAFMEGIL